MNKERFNQIIDEVYKRYLTETMFHPEDNWLEELDGMDMSTGEIKKVYRQYVLKEFVNKCKTDLDFSQKWGLTIEERELSLEERKTIYENEYTESMEVPNNHWLNSKLTTRNIPTKVTTITYKDNKIETYG